MTQEEKDLLLKDLCGRLPYKPKVHVKHDVFYNEREPYDTVLDDVNVFTNLLRNGIEIKPYLRPLDNMTEEENEELSQRMNDDALLTGDSARTIALHCSACINFFNEKMFDYNDLIKKGLAISDPVMMKVRCDTSKTKN